jgi:hypothetical protein
MEGQATKSGEGLTPPRLEPWFRWRSDVKRFKVVLPMERVDAAHTWSTELALTLSAELEIQALTRARMVLGKQWPHGFRFSWVRLVEED